MFHININIDLKDSKKIFFILIKFFKKIFIKILKIIKKNLIRFKNYSKTDEFKKDFIFSLNLIRSTVELSMFFLLLEFYI